MSSDQLNLFNDNTQTPAQPVEQPNQPNPTPAPAAPIDPFAQMLSNIRADDGRQKYNSVPDALNALDHSQKYIAQLQAQIKELEAKAAQNVTMEQVLERINAQPKESTQPQQAGLTPEDVLALLQQQEAKKKAEANAAAFVSRFKELYGEKAQETFYGKAAEMGLSAQQIESLVATSPQAVYTMFGMTEKPVTSAPMPNGINTAAIVTPAAPEIKTAMGFVSEKQLVDSWKQIKDAVNAQYGIK